MRLTILYGSQTGTAQDVAEQIWRESKSLGLTGPVLPLDDYDISNLINEKFVVFVVSTTGQGDEPDNMKNFWKFLLRKSLPKTSLAGMHFACLGLGDSGYEKYNFAAKKLSKRLLQLSAKAIIPMGLCDDQHDHGPAAVFAPWIRDLWATFKAEWPEHVQERDLEELPCKVRVKVSEKEASDCLKRLQWPYKDAPIEICVKKSERTTAEDHFQDVRFISFDCPDDLTWNCGDILNVRPANTDVDVDTLFKVFEEANLPFKKDTVVEFEKVFDGEWNKIF